MNRLALLWDYLHTSFWFVPAVMVAAATVLAVTAVEIDQRNLLALDQAAPRLFGVGTSGARAVLSAIATSMMTVAGVVFSITIVTLSLASSQYSPRVLQNFVRDRTNQVVLGVFVSVFAYCLVVLRIVGAAGDEFVPTLSVFGAVLSAFAAIGFLIVYIHHVAWSIQATSVIEAAANETLHAIDHLFPHGLGEGPDEGQRLDPQLPATGWQTALAPRNGYIQNVNPDQLLPVAERANVVVRLERGIGDYVVEGTPLVSIFGGPELGEQDVHEITAAFSISRRRTVEQDAQYGIRQLVDIALRSLSPSVNDTTTAEVCLDYLTAVLARLVRRRIESPYRYHESRLRVVAHGPTFRGFLRLALEQIRYSGSGNAAVYKHLGNTLKVVGGLTTAAPRRQALVEQAEALREAAQRTLESPYEREEVLLLLDGVLHGLVGPHPQDPVPSHTTPPLH